MKPLLRLSFLLALPALPSFVQAQLTTFDTRPAYLGSAFTFTPGSTLGQSFSNIYAVSSLTFNFFNSSIGTTTGNTLSATFGEWNAGSFVAGTTVSFGTITVPASGSAGWTTIPGANNPSGGYPTFQVTFDFTNTGTNNVANSTLYNPDAFSVPLDATLGYLTNPNLTYALMLTDTGGGNNLALGLTNTDVFSYGATNMNFNDWVFAQISVATTNPVPEASTVAAMIGAAFIAGLVGLRIRQRRQLAALPAAPAAA